mmetsp:Transcript_54809/g.117024  ORF Transcript_54809/g.117024 Transcript_54809/m.117024 type:complete len:276 (-) Transcript_54809:194-1021(-)
MEGPILEEFSKLNAQTHRSPTAATASRATSSGDQSARADRPRSDSLLHKERLLRGESTYTAGPDGRPTEHFIEDQPQVLPVGVGSLLPRAATTEERERLLRRLEMCAKAREESTKIMSIRYAQRDAVKHELRRERQGYMEKLMESARDRDQRWTRKLQKSPFAIDLVAENQRIDEENRVQQTIERRRRKMQEKRNREAHNAIFSRATAEHDELSQLRLEKRLLIENERQLKALRDVEKSNARTAQILQERRQKQLEREHLQMSSSMGSSPPWTAR